MEDTPGGPRLVILACCCCCSLAAEASGSRSIKGSSLLVRALSTVNNSSYWSSFVLDPFTFAIETQLC